MHLFIDKDGVRLNKGYQVLIEDLKKKWSWVQTFLILLDMVLESALKNDLVIRCSTLQVSIPSFLSLNLSWVLRKHREVIDHGFDHFQGFRFILLSHRHLNHSIFLELGEEEVCHFAVLETIPIYLLHDVLDVTESKHGLLGLQDRADKL